MAKKDIGAKFEEVVQSVLDELVKTKQIRYMRLYDTKSARGAFMPNQPGDFLIAAAGTTRLVECKASEVHESLKAGLSSLMPELAQAAHLRLWQEVAACPSLVLFRSHASQRIEAWDGKYVGKCRAEGKRLHAGQLLLSLPNTPEGMRSMVKFASTYRGTGTCS